MKEKMSNSQGKINFHFLLLILKLNKYTKSITLWTFKWHKKIINKFLSNKVALSHTRSFRNFRIFWEIIINPLLSLFINRGDTLKLPKLTISFGILRGSAAWHNVENLCLLWFLCRDLTSGSFLCECSCAFKAAWCFFSFASFASLASFSFSSK